MKTATLALEQGTIQDPEYQRIMVVIHDNCCHCGAPVKKRLDPRIELYRIHDLGALADALARLLQQIQKEIDS